MASLEFGVLFTHDIVVPLTFSEAKEFISITVALLEANDKLKLEDKVKMYFPKLPAWNDDVNIQDLLNHNSVFPMDGLRCC